MGRPLILLEGDEAVAEILQLGLDDAEALEILENPATRIEKDLPLARYDRNVTRPTTVLSGNDNLTFETQGTVGARTLLLEASPAPTQQTLGVAHPD